MMKWAVGGAAGYSGVNSKRRWKIPSSKGVCSGISPPSRSILTWSLEHDNNNVKVALLSFHDLDPGRRGLSNGEDLLVDSPYRSRGQSLQT